MESLDESVEGACVAAGLIVCSCSVRALICWLLYVFILEPEALLSEMRSLCGDRDVQIPVFCPAAMKHSQWFYSINVWFYSTFVYVLIPPAIMFDHPPFWREKQIGRVGHTDYHAAGVCNTLKSEERVNTIKSSHTDLFSMLNQLGCNSSDLSLHPLNCWSICVCGCSQNDH